MLSKDQTFCANLSGLPDKKLKTQEPKTYITPSLSCFINNCYGFWNLTFGHQAKVTYKVRKSVYNIEMYFKQISTCLEKTSAFITSTFRTIYISSLLEVLSKKRAFCCRYVAYLQKNTHAEVWFQ